LNLQWVRSCFGLVSQEPVLFDLTIAENIAYGLENIPIEDIINAATKANVHHFIQELPQVSHKKMALSTNLILLSEIFRDMKQK
jgi:ATP-binding cassette, subfamily B (MDR/TAP), member 1